MELHDFPTANNALEGVDAADKESAAFHNIAGMVAATENNFTEAETHFMAASKLEPLTLSPQLNLAIVRLHGSNNVELVEARGFLQRLSENATNSSMRCQALRELTLDATRHDRPESALAFCQRLAQE